MRPTVSTGIKIGLAAALIAAVGFVILAKTNKKASSKVPKNVVLWGQETGGDNSQIRQLEDDLRSVILPKIEFQKLPLKDCLNELNKMIAEVSPDTEALEFEIVPNVDENSLVSLRLVNVPLAEALRYTTSLSQGKYCVRSKRLIEIRPIKGNNEVVEGWFCPFPGFYAGDKKEIGPVDVRHLFANTGIYLEDPDLADYYPSEGLLRVSTTWDEMELIDAYLSSVLVCDIGDPTILDHLYGSWYAIQDWIARKYGAPVSAPSSSSSASGIADPFGGGSINEPDPFR